MTGKKVVLDKDKIREILECISAMGTLKEAIYVELGEGIRDTASKRMDWFWVNIETVLDILGVGEIVKQMFKEDIEDVKKNIEWGTLPSFLVLAKMDNMTSDLIEIVSDRLSMTKSGKV